MRFFFSRENLVSFTPINMFDFLGNGIKGEIRLDYIPKVLASLLSSSLCYFCLGVGFLLELSTFNLVVEAEDLWISTVLLYFLFFFSCLLPINCFFTLLLVHRASLKYVYSLKIRFVYND